MVAFIMLSDISHIVYFVKFTNLFNQGWAENTSEPQLFLWLCGHMALWSYGFVVIWLCGHAAWWSCGLVVMWLGGHV